MTRPKTARKIAAREGPRLSIRIDLAPGRKIGPGKIALLKAIADSGSIAAAAKELGMSYSRAWDLVEDLNRLFRHPLIHARSGGRKGGGAALTKTGLAVLALTQKIEGAAERGTARPLAALARIGRRR